MARTIKAPRNSVRYTSRVVAPLDDFHVEELSTDESDCGNARKKGGASPPKKANKQSFAKSSSGSDSGRQTTSLGQLLAMPLDVLLEVFSHLDPKDIIHVCRTSRFLRDILMTRNSISVWRAARERIGAPESPSNMNEPQWAAVLFGNVCQTCGARNIERFDFSLMRRACKECKDEYLLTEKTIKTCFPGSRIDPIDPDIFGLMPSTNVGPTSHPTSHGCFFWFSDVEDIRQKLKEYQLNIRFHHPGAQRALDNFKAQRAETVTSIRKLAYKREMWYQEYTLSCYEDKLALGEERFDSIQSKFIKLGYKYNDVESIRWESECRLPTPLTEQTWKHIRPILEPIILKRQQERLQRTKVGKYSSRTSYSRV
ncbi:hypothetical protein M413DRAFT_326355 [Hebeloma cylindrosporum]|uniref:F-box domain-containing protein n=1 Tax=Hebeloma cylindrosporum TaxID=76867 RepID=A0A0C2XD26_HEBCY|nr:hypothetical protein M413DRAFT_326355 [Hebeloma cylindrosporum h7]